MFTDWICEKLKLATFNQSEMKSALSGFYPHAYHVYKQNSISLYVYEYEFLSVLRVHGFSGVSASKHQPSGRFKCYDNGMFICFDFVEVGLFS